MIADHSFILPDVLLAVGARAAFASTGPDIGSVPGAPEFNLLWQSFQVVLALSVTLVLLVGTVWLFRKLVRVNRTIPGGAVRLIEIQHVDPKKAIALVKVMNRVLIVGWAENAITLLGELTPEEAASLSTASEVEPGMFGTLFARFVAGSSKTGGPDGRNADDPRPGAQQ